ncbi:acetate kinase [Rhodoferax sp. WC2427]|uniref:acetate kinase n=1 Tax=Rhodoferax sp. WC2427 TaxID=3234144 RepID=UPI0034671B7B
MKTFCEDRTLLLVACSSVVWACTSAHAQDVPPAPSVDQRIEALQQLVAEQGRQIEALRQQVNGQPGVANDAPQPANNAPVGAAEGSTQAVRVGVAPSEDPQVPKMVQLFDQPGILTPRGHYVLEPSMQYGYSSSNRVALVGYTIIPALLIGLIDVREVKSHVTTAALAARWGITNRLEGELKIPYVYRSDSTVSREIFTGSASDRVFNNSGKAVGDIEVAARYQLNQPKNDFPFLIGSLRFKSRTGKDPFEVVTDCVTRCVGNTTGTGLPMELPTGSGFYSLQTGLTWLMPSDPAVFFGSFTYTHNFGRSDVSRTVLGGEREFLGSIKPGDVLGINFGVGLAINEHSTFSVGVDMNSLGRTRQNGQPVAGSVRTQLSSLLLGYSYRISPKTTINVAVAAGLTPDTPNLTLTVRIPIAF